MELYTLDYNFQPVKMIENYSSLIWTERYSKYGDFQLISSDVAGCISQMPRETYVTLRETTVPMIIEDHKIEFDSKGAPQVTITGRTFETVLGRRSSVNSLPVSTVRETWTITAAKPSDAAYKAIRIVLGDVARYRTDDSQPLASEVSLGTMVLPAVTPAISALDAIPEVNLILPKDYSTLTPNSYEIKAGNLYEVVLEMLKLNRRGLKATRPLDESSKVNIEIYNGADLTSTVSFDAKFDQFDKSTYLFSEQGSQNVSYVYGPNGSDKVLKNAVDASHPEPSGLARRVQLVDESSDETLNSSVVRQSRGLIELYKYNPTALFDGEIAMQVAAGYNKDYFLGDILLLVGEYELSEKVRVAEFIRSSDDSGESAYPTFEAIYE